MANERKGAQLLSDVETARHEKEKELVSQKHHLEFLLVGIRESTQFGEVLVKEGSESEIVASQKDVVSRLFTLGQEKEKSQMEPVTDSTIVFDGGGEIGLVGEVFKGFGSVVSKDISAEKSYVEGQRSGSVIINHSISFKVNVIDKKGNRVTSSPKGKGIIPFVVEITLNGNQQRQQVKIEEIQGKEGEFSVSLTPTSAGQHQISVSHKGKDFKGSPFRIDAVDRPKIVYRSDYNTVGINPVLQFGSSGSGDGQFSNPRGVACNSRGDIFVVEQNGQFASPGGVTVDQRNNQIVVADCSNHRIQVFDEKSGFILAIGSQGSGDGQLSGPWGVVVDSQGNYLSQIWAIVEFLYSTRMVSS